MVTKTCWVLYTLMVLQVSGGFRDLGISFFCQVIGSFLSFIEKYDMTSLQSRTPPATSLLPWLCRFGPSTGLSQPCQHGKRLRNREIYMRTPFLLGGKSVVDMIAWFIRSLRSSKDLFNVRKQAVEYSGFVSFV